ncbi:hypothetical protein RGR602_PC00950 (plasmid) [Rhizobium gallicum bv. gallicum R602sp]|uniref:Uncharacterized protein n=1 Tax=Rhizobium gallicum bv. gallicum R602sp TaxID=1041138 RepID=A0A0B4XEE0_9HYPH|nr:hypothetical protein RGR602_PC00950 [Rhizobium gallicum bv. gallicum R602sp]
MLVAKMGCGGALKGAAGVTMSLLRFQTFGLLIPLARPADWLTENRESPEFRPGGRELR